jgi:hypothetical protein
LALDLRTEAKILDHLGKPRETTPLPEPLYANVGADLTQLITRLCP